MSEDTIEAVELRLEKKRAERAEAEKAQYLTDLLAREALEEEHGVIAAVKVARFSPGFPTRAFLKRPDTAQYKRFVAQIGKAVDKSNSGSKREASDLLAMSCWVYPAPGPDQKAMLEEFPGLLTMIASAAASLAEGKAEEEGKG